MMSPEQMEREGQKYYSGERYDKALPYIQELQRLGRKDSQLRVYEAQCLFYLQRAPEAVRIMRGLLAGDEANIDYRILLSQYLRAVGDFEKSYGLVKSVPESLPGRATLMGWHTMRIGDFLGGFRFFQSEPGIIQLGEHLKLPAEKYLKKGTDIKGKTLLYLLEGGFGDEILFSRFVPKLEEQGAHVILGVSKRILELMRGNPYVRDTRDVGTITADMYDYCLPAIFSIDMLEITDPRKDYPFPYLFADPAEVSRWKPIIEHEAKGRKKIGIHWQGNWGFDYADMKSLPGSLMTRLSKLGQLFSLQRDAGENTLPLDADVFDTEAGPPSWASTAAVISQMDYIVTNDTSTAHLAGALGKKILVVVPHAPHIYWIMKEGESIWYPHMHLFRQPKYNDWEGAVQLAYEYLANELRKNT